MEKKNTNVKFEYKRTTDDENEHCCVSYTSKYDSCEINVLSFKLMKFRLIEKTRNEYYSRDLPMMIGNLV